jgi:hypothetical protein
MEQLHVVSAVTGKVQLERYAGNFQVCGSVLPVRYATAQQWWEHGGMQWAKQNNDTSVSSSKQEGPKKKRRKVIVDSSSDEEDTKPSAKVVNAKNSFEKENEPKLPSSAAAAGLVVKEVVDTVKNEKSTALQSSVNAIKKQFGVNVAGMQEAFDGLQAEEAGAVRKADLVDNAPVDAPLKQDELYDIQVAERRVKRKKWALLRALEDVDYDDVDTAICPSRSVNASRRFDLVVRNGSNAR